MAITVTTGGPIVEGLDTTFGDMISAIADDIDDTNNEYNDAIRRAILGAIRYCEREPWYFNETRDITFSTAEGQEWYDENDSSDIPYIITISGAWLEDTAGNRTPLRRATPEELETLIQSS